MPLAEQLAASSGRNTKLRQDVEGGCFAASPLAPTVTASLGVDHEPIEQIGMDDPQRGGITRRARVGRHACGLPRRPRRATRRRPPTAAMAPPPEMLSHGLACRRSRRGLARSRSAFIRRSRIEERGRRAARRQPCAGFRIPPPTASRVARSRRRYHRHRRRLSTLSFRLFAGLAAGSRAPARSGPRAPRRCGRRRASRRTSPPFGIYRPVLREIQAPHPLGNAEREASRSRRRARSQLHRCR